MASGVEGVKEVFGRLHLEADLSGPVVNRSMKARTAHATNA